MKLRVSTLFPCCLAFSCLKMFNASKCYTYAYKIAQHAFRKLILPINARLKALISLTSKTINDSNNFQTHDATTERFAIQFFFFSLSPLPFRRKGIFDFSFFFFSFFLLLYQFISQNEFSFLRGNINVTHGKCDCPLYAGNVNFRETHPVFTGAIKIPIFTKLIAYSKSTRIRRPRSSGLELARRSGGKKRKRLDLDVGICSSCSQQHRTYSDRLSKFTVFLQLT